METWVDTVMKSDVDRQNQMVETMNLALQCTAGDPAARPTAPDLLNNLESIGRSSSCVSYGFNKLFSC